MLWDAVRPLALLFRRPEDSKRKWVDMVRDIPNRFEGYVQGAAKVSVRNVLGGKGVVGSSLSTGLSTLIAPRIIAPIVPWATWELFVGMFFRCNHLLYCALEFLGYFQVVVIEFLKLPLVFDLIGEVIYHLPVCDIIDLGL
jgi:hypothetical protein